MKFHKIIILFFNMASLNFIYTKRKENKFGILTEKL